MRRWRRKQESLANLQEQVRFARANQREGFLTRTDVAQAEARVAQARADLARARARVTEAVQLYTRDRRPCAGRAGSAAAACRACRPISTTPWRIAEDEHPTLVAATAEMVAANAAVDLAAANGRLRLFLEFHQLNL